MLEFLTFEKGMITRAFLPLESVGKNATTEELQAKYDKLKELSAEESTQLGKVNVAQEAYGKENGFTIEAAPEKESEGG